MFLFFLRTESTEPSEIKKPNRETDETTTQVEKTNREIRHFYLDNQGEKFKFMKKMYTCKTSTQTAV